MIFVAASINATATKIFLVPAIALQNIVFKTVLHVVFFTIISAIVPQHIMITDNIFINCLSGRIFFGFSNIILLYVGASETGLDLIGLYVNTKKNANVMGKVNFILV